MLDSTDLFLIDAVINAEKTDAPLSSWVLAQLWIKARNRPEEEIKKYDQKFRYRLSKLADKGILKREEYSYKGRTYIHYTPNPERVVCTDGAIWILENPITILNCPYYYNNECPHKKVEINKCKLYLNSPREIQKLIEKHLLKE